MTAELKTILLEIQEGLSPDRATAPTRTELDQLYLLAGHGLVLLQKTEKEGA